MKTGGGPVVNIRSGEGVKFLSDVEMCLQLISRRRSSHKGSCLRVTGLSIAINIYKVSLMFYVLPYKSLSELEYNLKIRILKEPGD